ncbi:procollagen-lysine,2-oxoglutarate 5-dioxygenase [Elysia marginata]|uniref:Procollagen-lysine,2-oxoglutarate 5-dioxygenase n=1 Tax=Elysia marginata TaxID=1093978 RepID=A0AAV4GH72_9GAST|nr:procollagen-lysine,2-oxoglutarate 5-dioxygenase [Elysia marginata]
MGRQKASSQPVLQKIRLHLLRQLQYVISTESKFLVKLNIIKNVKWILPIPKNPLSPYQSAVSVHALLNAVKMSPAQVWARTLLFALCFAFCLASQEEEKSPLQDHDLLVITVATKENDGFRQFMKSAKKYGLDVKVFGMGQEWLGGTMDSIGGGHKINLLKEGLKPYKSRKNLILMFVDSYDVIITADKEAILEKFSKFNSRVVISAENTCWPDRSLAHEWDIKLDTRAEIFQNLNHALDEIMIKYKGDHSYMYNVKTGTLPIVLHGNGPIKPEFFRLSNYLADGWTTTSGCQACKEDLLDLGSMKEADYPLVQVALFIEFPTPFIREFFQRVSNLIYPKSNINLYIHNTEELHTGDVSKFVDEFQDQYNRVIVTPPEKRVTERVARDWVIEECMRRNCNYLLMLDSIVQLTNPELLTSLIKQNRSIIAPMLMRPGKLWSNFWGALSHDGFYARSEDYMDIAEKKKIGLWNVPHLGNAMLIQAHCLPALKQAHSDDLNLDSDMSFSQVARSKMVFMYVDNQAHWGHLVYAEYFDTNHLNNELFDIFNNPLDWKERYIHKDYDKALEEGAVIEQPCPDVYWFPIVTDTFCDEFVAEFENFGKWSGGKNHDPRLAGGYENVPTVDIHMNQVGLEQQWLKFLEVYIRPLQEAVFTGYYHNPPQAIMNFIVRYRPDEQPLLRPHHDASTYTINIALNRPGIDFEGGGCRFVRYNCSITSPRKGWMFMHPGRLTHYHEGLRTTSGTRYIMISFVDP